MQSQLVVRIMATALFLGTLFADIYAESPPYPGSCDVIATPENCDQFRAMSTMSNYELLVEHWYYISGECQLRQRCAVNNAEGFPYKEMCEALCDNTPPTAPPKSKCNIELPTCQNSRRSVLSKREVRENWVHTDGKCIKVEWGCNILETFEGLLFWSEYKCESQCGRTTTTTPPAPTGQCHITNGKLLCAGRHKRRIVPPPSSAWAHENGRCRELPRCYHYFNQVPEKLFRTRAECATCGIISPEQVCRPTLTPAICDELVGEQGSDPQMLVGNWYSVEGKCQLRQRCAVNKTNGFLFKEQCNKECRDFSTSTLPPITPKLSGSCNVAKNIDNCDLMKDGSLHSAWIHRDGQCSFCGKEDAPIPEYLFVSEEECTKSCGVFSLPISTLSPTTPEPLDKCNKKWEICMKESPSRSVVKLISQLWNPDFGPWAHIEMQCVRVAAICDHRFMFDSKQGCESSCEKPPQPLMKVYKIKNKIAKGKCNVSKNIDKCDMVMDVTLHSAWIHRDGQCSGCGKLDAPIPKYLFESEEECTKLCSIEQLVKAKPLVLV